MAMTRRRQGEVPEAPAGDTEWFRPPNRRENVIAAGLFIGFAIFFALLFVVLAGWWFRWVIICLGVISLVHGVLHVRDAVRYSSAKAASERERKAREHEST